MNSHLADTSLGREVLRQTGEATVIVGLAGLPGALLPLIVGAIVTPAPWLAIVAAVGALGALGAVLGRNVAGSPARWAMAMMASGALVSALGAVLHIA